jgi:hypothetical protein
MVYELIENDTPQKYSCHQGKNSTERGGRYFLFKFKQAGQMWSDVGRQESCSIV